MKTTMKLAVLGLVLGMMAAPSAQAGAYSSKGPRFDGANAAQIGRPLTTLGDFKSLGKGETLVVWCPMMNATIYTTVRNVDSKGRIKIKETKQGYSLGGCNIVLRKVSGGKQVNPVMICPDGKIRPVECSVMGS